MAIIISPSVRTTRAWRRYVNYPIRIDLVNLVWGLLTLLFALCAGVTHNLAGYSAAGSAAFCVLTNISAPLLSLFISLLNVYLYTRKVLRPGYALGINIFMTLCWIAQVVYWVVVQLPFGITNSPIFTDFGLPIYPIPWTLSVPMLIGGPTLLCTTFSYMVVAWIAVVKCKTKPSGAKKVKSLGSQECVELHAKSNDGSLPAPSVQIESVVPEDTTVETTAVGSTSAESIHSESTNGQSINRSIVGRSINGRSLHSQSTRGGSYRSLPDYDDIISIGARAAAMDEIEANEKKPELADTCYCGNCGASYPSSSRSSFRSGHT